MATPPFTIQTTLPGDSDIVSQFPQNERTNRDVIQSWLLVDHDNLGDHKQATFPWQSATPSTPGASLTRVYASAAGRLQIVYPDGSVGFVGLPPSSIIFYSGNVTPVGYLIADGSAVSRSTYADLFVAIGTIYGIGDGSTTFNLPDLRGRYTVGEDATPVHLANVAIGGRPVSLGQFYDTGNGMQSLALTNLPPITAAGSITNGTIFATNVTFASIANGGQSAISTSSTGSAGGNLQSALNLTQGASTFNGGAIGGVSTPFSTVGPLIVQRALIKV